MTSDRSFREKLSRIINNITEWNDLIKANQQLEEQRRDIDDLSNEFDHSISVVRHAKREDSSSYNYTCYMYACDLMDAALLKRITKGSTDIYPNACFVTYLILRFLKEIQQESMKDGDLVVYFHRKLPVHAGKWHDRQVISKWGKHSHLWQHRVFEVPLEYGEDIRFFRRVLPSEIEFAFRQWAEFHLSKPEHWK